LLWQRLLTAAIGIPLLLVLVYLGGWYLGAAILLLATLGLAEYFGLAAACGLRPIVWVGYAAGAAVVVATALEGAILPSQGFLAEAALNDELAIILASAAIALLVQQVVTSAGPVTIANAGATLLGIAYLPVLFSCLLRLRSISLETTWLSHVGMSVPSGACWLFLVIAACWAGDTAAYAIGRAFGRHKLCPDISPGKTVEGAAAALVASVVAAAALGRWFGLSLTYGVILGVMLGVAGQLGDLSKSIMKRQAGVKDSGAILPGHGGILDRFDSLLFSGPIAYYYLRSIVS